jgi:hypothetical protein
MQSQANFWSNLTEGSRAADCRMDHDRVTLSTRRRDWFPGGLGLLRLSYPRATIRVVDDDTQRLIEYRQSLADLLRRSWESFDRTLTALASGALAVSLAFVHDLAPGGVHMWGLLAAAWVLFAISLATNLFSYVTTGTAADFGIKQIDEDLSKVVEERDADRIYGGRWRPWTRGLNRVAAIAFGSGVASLLAFAIVNVSRATGGAHG